MSIFSSVKPIFVCKNNAKSLSGTQTNLELIKPYQALEITICIPNFFEAHIFNLISILRILVNGPHVSEEAYPLIHLMCLSALDFSLSAIERRSSWKLLALQVLIFSSLLHFSSLSSATHQRLRNFFPNFRNPRFLPTWKTPMPDLSQRCFAFHFSMFSLLTVVFGFEMRKIWLRSHIMTTKR